MNRKCPLQFFDAVGRATGRTYHLYKVPLEQFPEVYFFDERPNLAEINMPALSGTLPFSRARAASV